MSITEDIFKRRGISPKVKAAYVSLFNSSENKERGKKVLDDLMIRFTFYGAKPTTDAIQLAKNAAYREVLEYILTMSARINEDTLEAIEQFINK